MQLVQRIGCVVSCNGLCDTEVGLRVGRGRHDLANSVGGYRRLPHRVQHDALETCPEPDEVEAGTLHEH